MAAKKPNKPFPFGVYFTIVTLICMVGLIDASYLSISHFRVYTDLDYRSFCAISKAINCDTVSQSPYSIFFNVPVPIWGVIGYLVVSLLLVMAWWRRNAAHKLFWPSIFIIALAYSINSVVLATISLAVIHSHCIMCILSHAVNFSLVFYAWLIHKRFENSTILTGLMRDIQWYRQHWKAGIAGFACLLATAVAMTMLFPAYWEMQLDPLDVKLKNGVTEEGYPWIGAEKPAFVINEFSDYQCFQCKKMHIFLRQLVARHRDKIRLVHRHFPMDHEYNPLVSEPFHTGSGKMAIIALYAQEKNQFWMINDLLYGLAAQKKDFNTKAVAEQMDITSGELVAALGDKYLRLRLKHDIAVGIHTGIRGTPGYAIDGQVYTGTIPKELLRKMMAEDEK
jgi:uncharacterized membrane protein/protein-disulfide isomerase